MFDMEDATREQTNEREEYEARVPYGFKQNLRIRAIDYEVRLDILDDILKGRYKVTNKRLLIGGFAIALVVLAGAVFLVSNSLRTRYIWLPVSVGVFSALVLAMLYMFVDPSTEQSLIYTATVMLNQQISMWATRKGKIKRVREIGLADTDETGMLYFDNGDIGQIFLVDGSTSTTAYPEEVRAQERIAQEYHNGRKGKANVTEIKITSLQRQNTDAQQRHARKLARMNRHTQGVREICEMHHKLLADHIDGKKTTVIQYLIIRSYDEESHFQHIERLRQYVSRGLYYKLTPLDGNEADRVLADIFSMRVDDSA